VVKRSQSPVAAVGGGEALDRIPVWLRTSASLAGVVALIVLLAWGYRLVAGAGGKLSLGGGNRHPGLVEKLSRVNLSPRQSLYLVRVGPQLVLIGATHDSLRALSIINDPNLAAQFAGRHAQLGAGSHLAEFNRCLESEAGAYSGGDDRRRDGEIPDVARTVSLKQRLAQTVERLKSMA
jgi:flagellar biogenesis protein FliO